MTLQWHIIYSEETREIFHPKIGLCRLQICLIEGVSILRNSKGIIISVYIYENGLEREARRFCTFIISFYKLLSFLEIDISDGSRTACGVTSFTSWDYALCNRAFGAMFKIQIHDKTNILNINSVYVCLYACLWSRNLRNGSHDFNQIWYYGVLLYTHDVL